MNSNDNQILIKDTSGQMKTVGLGLGQFQPQNVATTQQISDKDDKNKQDKSLEKEIKKVIDNEIKIQAEKNKIKEDKDKIEKKDSEPPINLPGLSLPQVELNKNQVSEEIPVMPKKQDVFKPMSKEDVAPAFYFDLKDEQEIAKFKNKDRFQKNKKNQIILEHLAEHIIQACNLNLDETTNVRLKKIINSRLREVRDLIDTKEALMRERNSGGVGLDKEQASLILKKVEAKRIEMRQKPEQIESELLAEEKQAPTVKPIKNDILKKVKPVSNYVDPSYRQSIVDKSVEQKDEPIKEVKQAPKIKSKSTPGQIMMTSQEIVKPQNKGYEPQLATPKFSKAEPVVESRRVLVGPVDELRDLSLEEFRKLDPDYNVALEKIKHKIEMLKDESYEKMTIGINAWRSSPVYLNYLDIGQQSMLQGKSVKEIISEKEKSNQSVLSYNEFEAVADFNQELSF